MSLQVNGVRPKVLDTSWYRFIQHTFRRKFYCIYRKLIDFSSSTLCPLYINLSLELDDSSLGTFYKETKMARVFRFALRVSRAELQMINALAQFHERSQSDVMRMLIRQAYKKMLLKLDSTQ